jgi:hypothetical protein
MVVGEGRGPEHRTSDFVCLMALRHNNSAYIGIEVILNLCWSLSELSRLQPSCYCNLYLESDLRRLFVYKVAIPIGSCHHKLQSQLVGIFTALAGNNVGEML